MALLLLYAAGIGAVHAQTPESDIGRRIDQLFSAYGGENSPGCALGVIRAGALVYQKGYGKANLEFGVPIDPHATVFD
ncbi:MAG: aminopeptidase, partial [Massilia sp.]